jgi:hypothetical protein
MPEHAEVHAIADMPASPRTVCTTLKCTSTVSDIQALRAGMQRSHPSIMYLLVQYYKHYIIAWVRVRGATFVVSRLRLASRGVSRPAQLSFCRRRLGLTRSRRRQMEKNLGMTGHEDAKRSRSEMSCMVQKTRKPILRYSPPWLPSHRPL